MLNPRKKRTLLTVMKKVRHLIDRMLDHSGTAAAKTDVSFFTGMGFWQT